jgi:hypothetical protein
VYEALGFGLRVRVIVTNQLQLEEHNAMLHVFSVREESLRYGREHYRPHSPDGSTLLYDLFKEYSEEPDMPDKLKEYFRESMDKILAGLPAEERVKGLSAEELARALSPETRQALARLLKANGLSAEPDAATDSPRE